MKFIKNGLLYDTEESELIHEEGVGSGSSNWYKYYKTKSGRFFRVYSYGYDTLTKKEIGNILGTNIEFYKKYIGNPRKA